MGSSERSFGYKFARSVTILADTAKVLLRHPILILPILIGWIFYFVEIIYFKYYFNWNACTQNQLFLVIFLIILSCCAIFSISSFIMLEIIEQIETNNKVNIFKAFSDAIFKDLYKALPIIFIWAFICFILDILEAIFSHKKVNDNENDTLTFENAARIAAEYQSFSLASLTFDLIKSGVRLIVFFIYPAIAWEEDNCIDAVKKAAVAIKQNFQEFLSGFFSIEIIVTILAIPAGIMFYLADERNIVFSDNAWLILIIYIAFVSSLYLYLQQMFATTLYLWIIKWKRAVRKAKLDKTPEPVLQDIIPPSLLDNVPDLKYR